MSFGLYAIGLAIAIGGLIYGAHLVHMPAHFTTVGVAATSQLRLVITTNDGWHVNIWFQDRPRFPLL
jgi:hypothetical protein